MLAAAAGSTLAAGALLATGCGPGPTASDLASLEIAPAAELLVGGGSAARFTAVALDREGASLAVGDVDWRVDDPAVATIDGGGTATAVGEGVTTVRATLGSVEATATLEVYLPEEIASYEAGTSYFGRNEYVEYIPGDLPVVLSAPHGGRLSPGEVRTRSGGVSTPDLNTLELTLAARAAFIEATGHAPHVVLSHLHRAKLDPNRDLAEAAEGDPYAENAWAEYHGFVERARFEVTAAFGGGMYFDMHGHGHDEQRLELGYLLSADRLNRPDASLNELSIVQMTSVREIGRTRPDTFAEVIRGATSLGGFLEAEGVRAVPGPSEPSPGGDPYFSGGYSTRRHGSLDDTELVSGIQIEHHFPGLRDTEEAREAYAERLAAAVEAFVTEHFGFFAPS